MLTRITFAVPGCLSVLNELEDIGFIKTTLTVFQTSADFRELTKQGLVYYSIEDGCVYLMKKFFERSRSE